MSEQKCDVGRGITLCYETFGDPGDPPMLLVMGLGTQMIAWHEDFCRELASHGYYVVRFDNRDIGHSTHLSGPPPTVRQLLTRSRSAARYSLADMAEDAAPAGRAGPRAGARGRRLDGRHDRPDDRRAPPALGALAGLDHVQHREPPQRPALAARVLDVPARGAAGARRLHPSHDGGLRADRVTGPAP